jgi:diguanylate cyclase (GGDEF)-like protein
MACQSDEAGDRPGAAAIAATALDTPIPDLGDVPQDWLNTLAAMRGLLAALADRAAPESPAGYPQVHGSRGYALLAEAVRLRDAGDVMGAAEHAVRAIEELKASEMVGSLRHYAMAVAACHPPPAQQARRYVESLVRRRRESRQRALGSARAGIEAERIRLENERLAQRAYVDELTGLANRHAYTRYLKRLAARPADRDIAVLAVDLDLFKLVNDRFGHAVGDEVLRQVAGLLNAGVRPTDMVARLGGDEFVVIMDASGELDAVDRGQAVVDQVADHPWRRVAAGLQVTVSVGAAAGPGARIMGLLQDADRGLYVAKASGRGRLGLPPPQAVSAG